MGRRVREMQEGTGRGERGQKDMALMELCVIKPLKSCVAPQRLAGNTKREREPKDNQLKNLSLVFPRILSLLTLRKYSNLHGYEIDLWLSKVRNFISAEMPLFHLLDLTTCFFGVFIWKIECLPSAKPRQY